MTPDTVQIGPLIISKAVFDVIWPTVTALVAGFLGWFGSYWNTKRIEEKRHNRELERSFNNDQRDAIGAALQFTNQIFKVVAKLKMTSDLFTSQQAIGNEVVDEIELRTEFDNTFSKLAELQKEIPKNDRIALLPGEYSKEMILVFAELSMAGFVNEFRIPIEKAISAVDSAFLRMQYLDSFLRKLYKDTYGAAAANKLPEMRVDIENEMKKLTGGSNDNVSQEPSPKIQIDLDLKINNILKSLKSAGDTAILENWQSISQADRETREAMDVMFTAWKELARDYSKLQNRIKLNEEVLKVGVELTKFLSFVPPDHPDQRSLSIELNGLIANEKSEQARLTVLSRKEKAKESTPSSDS